MKGARVTLKQHRFEALGGALLALAIAAYALFAESRLAAVAASSECIKNWLDVGASERPDCEGVMGAWGAIVGTESHRILAAMTLLPFVVGLVGGVPLVGRELELRTAQTAWSLEGSRVRWLTRQAVPVGLILGIAVAIAATIADLSAQHQFDWGEGAYSSLGGHGPLILVRGFAAFAVGMFAGAWVGRTLPSLLLAALMIGAASIGVGHARDLWVHAQTPTVTGDSITSVTVDWAWRTPDGRMISDGAAKALVPLEVAQLDAGLEQAINSIEWLNEHDYELVPLGVSDEMANSWTQYDALLYGLVGIAFVGASAWLVARKRPT